MDGVKENTDGTRMRESGRAGCGGVASQREVPGRKKKGKEKAKEPGWGKNKDPFQRAQRKEWSERRKLKRDVDGER